MSESLLGGNGNGQTFRQRVHDMVEGTLDTWFEFSLLGVIFINVVALIFSSVPTYSEKEECYGSECERLGDKYNRVFEVIEWASVVAFTLEYFMRFWACIEDPTVKENGPVLGRIKYMLGFYPLVDLVSILPNWVSLATLALSPLSVEYVESPDFTTAARIFRLVRIFKTDKYINAFAILGNVLAENSTLLLATSFYSGMSWIISASLLYYTERDNHENEMSKHFQSIPLSMFPTLLMLTGEFPLADFSPIGQGISCVIAVVAVAIFAVPTSVLGAGFIKAVQQSQHRSFTMDMD